MLQIYFNNNNNIYFAPDSFSVSQGYFNNTIIVSRNTVEHQQMLHDNHRQHMEMPNTEITHHL